MRSYPEKLEVYKRNQRRFSKDGYTHSIAKRIIKIAWLDVWDTYHLFCYGKEIPDGGTYVEIGSYIGGSLLCVYKASRVAKVKINLIGIEPIIRPPLLEYTKSIPRLKIIHAKSDAARRRIKNDSVDLFFIDGSHGYEQVKRDISNYWQKLKIGGILLGHDYSGHSLHRGVVRAAKETFGKRLKRLVNSRVFIVQKQTKELR